MITEFEKEVFEFLDKLRESGVTNMFGATHYIMEEFNLEKRHAKILLTKWMEKK
jgi:hypothetical protein